MKVGCPAALGMTLVLAFAAPASSAYFDHSPYDGILRHYVDEDGTVDYDGIRLNSLTALESYFETLANADLAGWPRPEQTAFWINAYNARVLYRVAQKPRLKKMSQAWGLLELPSKVAGRMISPVDIKHLLRKSGDPRILFALSDGTLGGPKLCNAAYTADTLDMMLEKEASTFVNSQNVQEIRGHLQLSNVFKWYEKISRRREESLPLSPHGSIRISAATGNGLKCCWPRPTGNASSFITGHSTTAKIRRCLLNLKCSLLVKCHRTPFRCQIRTSAKTDRILSGDRKIRGSPFGGLPLDADVVHAPHGRALFQFLNEVFDGLAGSFDKRLYRSIGEIADPAGEAGLTGEILREKPKADPCTRP